MSVEHLAVVLHHSKMSGTPKVVLLGIANHDGDGGAWPEIKTLAKYARVTVRNVQKAIQECVAAGELRVEPRWKLASDGTPISMTNRYHLLVRCPPNCDRSFQHREIEAGQQGEASYTTGPPVGDDTRGGVADDTTPLSETTPKPSLNRPSEPQTSSTSVPRAPRDRKRPKTFDPPPGWKPNETHTRLVRESNLDPQRELAAFLDDRKAKGIGYVDWDAGFRTWLRNAARFAGPGPGRAPAPRPSATERAFSEADQALAQLHALHAAAEPALNGSSHQLQIGS